MDAFVESIIDTWNNVPDENLDDVIDSALDLLGDEEVDQLLGELAPNEILGIIAENREALMGVCCCIYHLSMNVLKFYVVNRLLTISLTIGNTDNSDNICTQDIRKMLRA